MISGEIFNATLQSKHTGYSIPSVRQHYAHLQEEGAGLFVPAWEHSETVLPRYYFHVPVGPPRQILFNRLHQLNQELDEPWRFSHWRSSGGAEVDFIVEAKAGGVLCALSAHDRVPFSHTGVRGIFSLQERYPDLHCCIVTPPGTGGGWVQERIGWTAQDRLLEALRHYPQWNRWTPQGLLGSIRPPLKARQMTSAS